MTNETQGNGDLINSLQSQNQLKIKAIETQNQEGEANSDEKKEDEQTIVCWNCLTVLAVKSDWGIVQCTNCDKFNRIPKEKPEPPQTINLNTNKNHFDVVAPYVYAVMTCPYCQSENKVRKEAEHIICFKCFNSFSIENPTIKCISSKKPLSIPSKCTRISDLYFPDPMMYPGKYSMPQYYINKECDNCQDKKFLINEMVRNVVNTKNPPNQDIGKLDKFAALRALLRDVDEIDAKRNLKIGRNLSGKYGPREFRIQGNIPYSGQLINTNTQNTKNKNENYKQDLSDNFLGKRNNINSFKDNKNEAIYKMMFSNWNNSYKM